MRNPAGWLRRAIQEGYDLDVPPVAAVASADVAAPASGPAAETTAGCPERAGEALQETLLPEDQPVSSTPPPDPRVLELWISVLEDLADATDSPGLRAWFKGVAPVGLEDETLTLSVPNPFAEEYIGSRFKEPIQELLRKRLSPTAQLRLTTAPPPAYASR